MNDKGDKIELPLPSNVDEFTVFKFLAPQGMRKTRFTFPIIGTNLKWEIDMFPKQDGEGFHEWCKIDLEVQDRNQPIPEFPIPLDDVILPEGYGRTGGPEVQDQVTKLYDEFFLLKNQFLPKQTEMAPATAQDEGIATSVAALPNDTAEPAVLDAGSSSDEAPAVTPETPNQDLPDAVPAQQSTDSPQAALDQALNQGVPDNLQVAPEPVIQEPTTGAEPPAEPVQEPGTPNAEPAQAQAPAGQATDPVNGGDAVTPEPSQPGVEPPAAVEPDLATKPEQPEEPIDDAKAEDQSVVEASKDEQEQQAEQTQSTTQTKVDALQAEKKAEAESQGKLDPTEDGKVPVDLIDNPAGDPSVMEPDTDTPEGAGEETSNGGNVTGATDGTDPDANALGTGDGLGGDLADGAGTTGTDAPDINDQDATDPGSEEGTEPTSTAGTAEGANGEGVDNSEVNGEQQVAANAPSKAETDEIPPEDKRKEEALQKQ
jgi:hypothetical protein